MNYKPTIGIEIHFELNTKTKMFSGALYRFKADANTCTNEIDLALPGTLPCVNKQAVVKALRACKGLNMEVDRTIRFDRKNYYYSDLPKGYQITQQFYPIGQNGYVVINDNGENIKIEIERLHMEEDTAKQFHLEDQTLIDYNRAGVPLVEIVSKPVIKSASQAALYVEKLKQILQYLDVSDAKMDEGSMRCDVNISLALENSEKLGTKVEIKNINSVNNIQEAIAFEIERQSALLDKGEVILQETRRFDEKTGTTVSMRSKEEAVDYKYFPEPNIFPIYIDDDFYNDVINNMNELPDVKLERYLSEYKITAYDASILMSNIYLANYFDLAVINCVNPKLLCNMLISELQGLLTKHNLEIKNSPIKPNSLKELVESLNNKEISSSQAKQILELMLSGKTCKEIIEQHGFKQESNDELILKIILEVFEEFPQSIIDFKNGKDRALGFMVGQVMKKSKGQANPEIASKLVRQELVKR